MGLDLAPKDLTEPEEEEPEGTESEQPPRPRRDPKPDDGRPRPSKENAAALQAALGDVGQFLDRELKNTGERIGIPPHRVD